MLFIIVLLTVLLRLQNFSASSELQFLYLHFISLCCDLKAFYWEALGEPSHPFINGYLLYVSELHENCGFLLVSFWICLFPSQATFSTDFQSFQFHMLFHVVTCTWKSSSSLYRHKLLSFFIWLLNVIFVSCYLWLSFYFLTSVLVC